MINFKNSFTEIRFWIFLFFILRLYAITDPPLEVAHNWRQTTVTMVARNFYETDNNILFPRVDFSGEKTGITGMEFPILNYLIYLVSLIFGYAHWYGRLINLVVSSFGIYYFYKLVLKYFGSRTAFNAAFLLLFSVWFNYSRKIMPDTFSMSFTLAGIYYGTNFLDRNTGFKNILLFFILTSIGILSKLPSAYLLSLFLFFIADKKIELIKKLVFIVTTVLVMTTVSVYYFYWVPHLVEEFGFFHFFMGKSLTKGVVDIFRHLGEAFEKFYLDALQIIGFVVFIAGLTVAFIRKSKKLLYVFGICLASFLVVVFKGGFAFYHHSYYIIPFAPVMALVAAYAIEQIPNKNIAWALLLVIALENVLNKTHDYQISERNKAILYLEKDLDNFSKKDDLILINSGNVPTPMYFAHRRGWINSNEVISQPSYVDSLKRRGLKLIVILKRSFGKDLQISNELTFENENYKIYKVGS